MSESGKSPRKFSREFKVSALKRLESGEALAAVSRELGVARKLLYEWRAAYGAFGAAGLNRKRGRKAGRRKGEARAALALSNAPETAAAAARSGAELKRARARIAELERLVRRQQADLHFIREALRLRDAKPGEAAPAPPRASKK